MSNNRLKLKKYTKKAKTTPWNIKNDKSEVRCREFSLPNHEKLTSELVVKVCMDSLTSEDKANHDELVSLTVVVCGDGPPVFEGAQWTRVSDKFYRTKIPLNKIVELAQSNSVRSIEVWHE